MRILQAMMQTGWWRWVLTGLSHAVRPASVYNFVRGLPFMWRQVRTPPWLGSNVLNASVCNCKPASALAHAVQTWHLYC
jgi:hypothetical protein